MQSFPLVPSRSTGIDSTTAHTGLKKRTKIVFLNPTEITNWDELKGNSDKIIHQDDFIKYENMLKNDSFGYSNMELSQKKKRGRPKGSKNGVRKRPMDPSQPWLEPDESDELDMGLENELDDDDYFRRLEEEKLREEVQEESRKRKEMRARAARFSVRGHTPGRRGRPRSDSSAACNYQNFSCDDQGTSQSRSRRECNFKRNNYAILAGMTEVSDSEEMSEQDNKVSSWIYNQESSERDSLNIVYEQEDEEFEEAPSPQRQSILDFLPPPPSPTVSIDEDLNPTIELGTTSNSVDALPSTTDDPHTLEMLAMDPIELRFRAPALYLPSSANDLVCPTEYLLDAISVYEVLRRYGKLLRLSPFRLEDFLACLIANENSNLLAESHIVLLKALLREDDANGTTMSPMDSKDSLHLSFYLLDRYNWPYLLAHYLLSVKTTEVAAYTAATSLTSLSLTAAYAAGATGGSTGGGGADTVLTAALFPNDLIPIDQNYPFVSIRTRLDVLLGLTNLFLATGPIRGDVLREGFLPHEDYCRVCHQSGEVLCCDGCTAVFHLHCLNPPMSSVPTTSWNCPVCLRTKVPGVSDCISEAERLRMAHRHESIGHDRAGRIYWYIGRRLIIEPVDFVQREPEFMGFMDGVRDDTWELAFGTNLKHNQANEKKNDADSHDNSNWQFHGNPLVDYAHEPVVYYYSSIEQVQFVRQKLHMDWEPWLCERLDALMPRMIQEMNLTQKLTQIGLGQFCQLRGANQTKSAPAPASASASLSYHALINLANLNLNNDMFGDDTFNVFSVFEAEQFIASSNAPNLINNEQTLCSTTGELGLINLPNLPIIPNDINLKHVAQTIICISDRVNYLVRNQDQVVQRFQKSDFSNYSTPNDTNPTVLHTNELSALTHLSIPSVIQSIPNLIGYRLSDEGYWRSWSNVYTVGVVWPSPSTHSTGSNLDLVSIDKSPSKHGSKSTSNDAVSDNKMGTDQSNIQINMALTKSQHVDDREKRRLLANKFNLTDSCLALWSYMDWPHLIQAYRDLYGSTNWGLSSHSYNNYPVKTRWPLNHRLDKFRIECWSACPNQLMDVLRLTMCYMEAQVGYCLIDYLNRGQDFVCLHDPRSMVIV